MFGTYRLLLSLLVAWSHMGVRWGGLNPGQLAVTSFYVLSGYVMTHTITNRFGVSAKGRRSFYIDRFLRLFPQYWVFMLATVVFEAMSKSLGNLGAVDYFYNAAILPLNFNEFLSTASFIPPAWSLGAELQFYLIIPFILAAVSTRSWLIVGSLAIFTASSIGLLNSSRFGYTLLPGVLFLFLTGSYLCQNHRRVLWRSPLTPPAVVWMVLACLLALVLTVRFFVFPGLKCGVNVNVMVGYLIGVPTIGFLACFPRNHRLDQALGNLAYGVFLCHHLAIRLSDAVLAAGCPFAVRLTAVALISVAFATVVHFVVEVPVTSYRKKLRSPVLIAPVAA
jgi:peptidoglycan/LPS O-acetylase OafA/YrhL